ncbi:MAG: glycoside hydrolase family 25 [Clostridia bacterium]|nr:glycoside hydrolase family 25 [Clostridia bacterium]
MKPNKKCIAIILAVSVVLLTCTLIVSILIYFGVILLNNPSREEYPVTGVDVSTYQGSIDWETLSSQEIDFVFIKATEGSSLVDPRFSENFAKAQEQDLAVGAYHFFSYDSSAEAQAQNFINTVIPFDGMLPPVIDLEFYGKYDKEPAGRSFVDEQLGLFIKAIEDHFGMNPIIYATERSYDLYLSGAYEKYDIWIRDVYFDPALSDGREWTFWQFTNRGRLKGYSGKEKYIDMNVFNGTRDEFDEYPRYKKN